MPLPCGEVGVIDRCGRRLRDRRVPGIQSLKLAQEDLMGAIERDVVRRDEQRVILRIEVQQPGAEKVTLAENERQRAQRARAIADALLDAFCW